LTHKRADGFPLAYVNAKTKPTVALKSIEALMIAETIAKPPEPGATAGFRINRQPVI
jgi:hypothetical protein